MVSFKQKPRPHHPVTFRGHKITIAPHKRTTRCRNLLRWIAYSGAAAVIGFAASWFAMRPPDMSSVWSSMSAVSRLLPVYYRNCDGARAAGTAPIHRGQPGYRSGLDADNDGVACEPWRGRR